MAGNFNGDAWRSEIRKNRGAVDSCPQSWRAHRQWFDGCQEPRRRGGKQSHAAQGREAAVTGEAIRASRKAEEEDDGESPEWRPAHGRWRSFTPQGYPLATSANPDGGSTNLRVGGVAGSEQAMLAVWSTSATVPSENWFRAPDRRSWSWIFSQFSMVTHTKLCSKVIELPTSYKFVTAAMGRFLLGHSWIYAQSRSDCTVCLKIQI